VSILAISEKWFLVLNIQCTILRSSINDVTPFLTDSNPFHPLSFYLGLSLCFLSHKTHDPILPKMWRHKLTNLKYYCAKLLKKRPVLWTTPYFVVENIFLNINHIENFFWEHNSWPKENQFFTNSIKSLSKLVISGHSNNTSNCGQQSTLFYVTYKKY